MTYFLLVFYGQNVKQINQLKHGNTGLLSYCNGSGFLIGLFILYFVSDTLYEIFQGLVEKTIFSFAN